MVIVVVTPNNPTGVVVTPSELEPLRRSDRLIVIDEAFGDLNPEQSLVDHVGPGVLVLKSLGKFFGLAGVRVGIAIAEPALAERLDRVLGLWRVSGPALSIATQAYGDGVWQRETRARLRRDAARLDALAPDRVLGGTDLFRLLHIPQARSFQLAMAERGILVRAFSYADDWVRLGLPGCEAEWAKLEMALKQLL
jgi:cobalamin biosynthetic protein CobC